MTRQASDRVRDREACPICSRNSAVASSVPFRDFLRPAKLSRVRGRMGGAPGSWSYLVRKPGVCALGTQIRLSRLGFVPARMAPGTSVMGGHAMGRRQGRGGARGGEGGKGLKTILSTVNAWSRSVESNCRRENQRRVRVTTRVPLAGRTQGLDAAGSPRAARGRIWRRSGYRQTTLQPASGSRRAHGYSFVCTARHEYVFGLGWSTMASFGA